MWCFSGVQTGFLNFVWGSSVGIRKVWRPAKSIEVFHDSPLSYPLSLLSFCLSVCLWLQKFKRWRSVFRFRFTFILNAVREGRNKSWLNLNRKCVLLRHADNYEISSCTKTRRGPSPFLHRYFHNLHWNYSVPCFLMNSWLLEDMPCVCVFFHSQSRFLPCELCERQSVLVKWYDAESGNNSSPFLGLIAACKCLTSKQRRLSCIEACTS